MEEQIARQVTDFLVNLTGQEGTITECLPEPTGWLVRVEVREAEEDTPEGRAAWVATYELHLDPLLAVVGCQRRAVRREPLDAGSAPAGERAPVVEALEGASPASEAPPASEPPAEEPPAAAEAPEPAPDEQPPTPPAPPGTRPRAPEPVTGAAEAKRVTITYRANTGED